MGITMTGAGAGILVRFDGAADEHELVGRCVGQEPHFASDSVAGGRAIGIENLLGLSDEETSGEFPSFGDGLESAGSELFEAGESLVEGFLEPFIEMLERWFDEFVSGLGFAARTGACASGMALGSGHGGTSGKRMKDDE